MTQPFRRIALWTLAAAAIIVAALSGFPSRGTADSLSETVLAMFPNDVGEFAYADMKTARQYPWFSQLRDQLLPSRFRDFEKFLASAGIDPNTEVDQVAWGGIDIGKTGGEEIVGVALGSFNPGAAEQRFKQQKLPVFDVNGYHLYAFGSGSAPGDILFTFIDPNTAAFGHRPALEKLIAVRSGQAESLTDNTTIYPLINDTNGTGIIWAVLDHGYTRLAMNQLLPQTNQFPQAEQIVGRLQAMTISIDADNGVDARFQAVCSSPSDANLLSAALQAGIMYKRYQEGQQNQALSSALDQVRVSPAGDRLNVDIPLSLDQLFSLIRSRAFAIQM
jgi:hypothetical protein